MQRSRQEWLKAGDKNTKFFQTRASHRRRKNTVRRLRRQDGSWCDSNETMIQMAQDFYQQLYSSEGSDNGEHILEMIQGMVSDKMNAALIATLTIMK
jgi:hypothetical protein